MNLETGHRPTLSILCPVFNEEVVIPLFAARMMPVIRRLSERYLIRLVFLNNASTDRTLDMIATVHEEWTETFVISMSRNVGYQASLQCGLAHIKADLYAFIDVDCEDPPEMIETFIERYEDGFDIVYGERVDRPEPPAIKAARKYFYRLLQKVADDDILLDMAEFSLITAEVREAVLNDRSSFPFLRASIARVGFRRCAVAFTRQRRIAGTTHYNLLGMSVFAVAGLLAASTLLLRLPVYLLPVWLFMLAVLGAGAVAFHSPWLLLAVFMVFAGYLGTAVACIALYVARAYKNGLQRPNAVIDRRTTRLPAQDPE
ncbi:MAG: glycosyltransferase family 2 protein [Rhodospirillales bacterium]|nr:glycosyltransferase family 2 protein [Rhodospirillales bacterium]MDE2318515.1 glycosyltransferase family 2 protein [Rhodospirillales bacterium]